MNKELAEYFFDQAKDTFAFLVKEHGFRPPLLIVDDQIHFAFAVYEATHIAIECVLDEREQIVECKIARVPDRERRDWYEFNDRGERIRVGLGQLVREKGVRENIYTRVTGRSLREKIPVTLGDFATMLHRYGADVLRDAPDAIFR